MTLVWQAEAAAAEAPSQPASPNTTVNQRLAVGTSMEESTEERSTADEALRQAMATGQLEQLSAALLLHTAACPDLLAEARTLRNQLRHRSKKQRLKAKKVVASMEALQQAIRGGTDVDALVLAIGTAERVSIGADDKPEMDRLLVAAHARLERAREEETAAQKVAAIETMESEFVALAMSQGACAEGDQLSVLDDLDDEASCVVSEREEGDLLVPLWACLRVLVLLRSVVFAS